MDNSREGTGSSIRPRVIGRIRTPFLEPNGTPIQPAYSRGTEGQVIVDDLFADALDDVEGFERVWLIYWLDRVTSFKLRVVPYRDTQERGLFGTRSPCRPNPIGMSVVRLVSRDGCILHISDVDILDDTPLLDIKPYVPEFDAHPSSKAGWFETCGVDRQVADKRFHESPGSTLYGAFSFDVLSDDSLVVTLDGTCIQSTAKHAHHELTLALLEGGTAGTAMESLIDLLDRFLSTTDFAALRTEHPELCGNIRCSVRLYRHDDGAVHWEVKPP